MLRKMTGNFKNTLKSKKKVKEKLNQKQRLKIMFIKNKLKTVVGKPKLKMNKRIKMRKSVVKK
jgi:hypothetical protein